jgi:hypothetical protein
MSVIVMNPKSRSTPMRPQAKLDALGATIEFIVPPKEVGNRCCIMEGTVMPPGMVIPLHSHDDFETYRAWRLKRALKTGLS